MNEGIKVALQSLIVGLVAIAGALGALSGSVAAVDWARGTLGDPAVYLLVGTVIGSLGTWSVSRGLRAGVRDAPSLPRQGLRDGCYPARDDVGSSRPATTSRLGRGR